MSNFLKDGLARNFLAGSWVDGDKGAAIAVEDPGNLEHVAGIYAHDLAWAHRVARKLRPDQVFINDWFAGGVGNPDSGAKKCWQHCTITW